MEKTYGGLRFHCYSDPNENGSEMEKDEILSDRYKIKLAVSARNYVVRKQRNESNYKFKWASVFGYDESWEEERVRRFALLKEKSLAESNLKESNGDNIYIDEEAAKNARKWAKNLHHAGSKGLSVDGKYYDEAHRSHRYPRFFCGEVRSVICAQAS